MTIFFATIGTLVLIVGSSLLFIWISELAQKKLIQKMNKRFEQVEKHLKESEHEVGTRRNYMQTN